MAESAIEEIIKTVVAATTPTNCQPKIQEPNPKPKYPTQTQSNLVHEILDETCKNYLNITTDQPGGNHYLLKGKSLSVRLSTINFIFVFL